MSKQRITRAIVLAAGYGSRLGQDGDTTPKPLRPVAGVPAARPSAASAAE